jgi:tetratricopeptide (TPR) repeat protein
MAKEQSILFDSPLYRKTIDIYKANLLDVIRWAQDKKVPVLLGTLASNIKDQPPFASVHPDDVDEFSFNTGMTEARRLMEQGSCREALAIFSDLMIKSPTYALTYYYAGKCEERLGNYEKARSNYRLARDYSAVRFRASSEINETVRELAQNEGVFLARVKSEIERLTPQKIIGKTFMLEHVHLTLEGYFIVGKIFAEAILEEGLLSRAPETPASSKSDRYFWDRRAVTPVDMRMAEYRMEILMSGWPFKSHYRYLTLNDIKPGSKVDQVALDGLKGKLDYWGVHLAMAQYYDSQKDFDAALAETRALVTAFPKSWRSHKAMGMAFVAAKRFDEALPHLIRVTEAADDAFAYKWAGTILLVQRRQGQAIPYLRKSLRLEPGDAQTRYNLGSAYASTGQRDRALKELEGVLAKDPGFPGARDMYARIRDGKQ